MRRGPLQRLVAILARPGRTFWLLLALALAVRLAMLALVWPLSLGDDALDYERHGRAIAAGQGYPESFIATGEPDTALRPPGYPAFLAAVFAVTGDSLRAAQLAQALLGTLAVGLVGLIAWQLWHKRPVALVAAGIAALYPLLALMSVSAMSEAVFVPLELGAVAASLRQREEPAGLRWAVLAGVLTGLAMLTRTVGIVLLVPLALLVWSRAPGGTERRLAPAAVLVSMAFLVVAPWTIRNAAVFDRFVPISTQGGISLAGAYNSAVERDPSHEWVLPIEVPEVKSAFTRPGLDEAEQSEMLRSRAWDYIRDNPGLPLEVAVQNLGRTLEVPPRPPSELDSALLGFSITEHDSARLRLAFFASAAGFLAVLALAIVAVVRGAWQGIPWPLWLIPALLTLSIVLIIGQMRYRLPSDFVLILLAAALLAPSGLGRRTNATSALPTPLPPNGQRLGRR